MHFTITLKEQHMDYNQQTSNAGSQGNLLDLIFFDHQNDFDLDMVIIDLLEIMGTGNPN